MTEQVRIDLDACDLLMQDHREVESLLRDVSHLQQNRRDAGNLMLNVCNELKMHDTLETEVFYAAVGAAGGNDEIKGLLDRAEEEHDTILELIEKVEQAHTQHKERDAQFAVLAERVEQHLLAEEMEVFPLVRNMKHLDLAAVTAAMKKRKAALIDELGIAEADEETV